MYRKLLIAHGGSGGGTKAFDMALQLAESLRAELDVLLVQHPDSHAPSTMDELTSGRVETFKSIVERLHEARSESTALSVPVRSHMIKGHDVSDIAGFMDRRGYDLLVIGHAGPASLYDRIMRHTADRLIELAPCPVLVIK